MTVAKKFESEVKKYWLYLGNSSIDRLYDVTNGYKNIRQVSDFIAYYYPNIYYLEVKTTKSNTFSISKFRQFKDMCSKIGIHGVRSGVIIWFYEHENKILYIPTKTFLKIKNEGKKSFNIHMDPLQYRYIEIPVRKKRTFYDLDLSVLLNELQDGD